MVCLFTRNYKITRHQWLYSIWINGLIVSMLQFCILFCKQRLRRKLNASILLQRRMLFHNKNGFSFLKNRLEFISFWVRTVLTEQFCNGNELEWNELQVQLIWNVYFFYEKCSLISLILEDLWLILDIFMLTAQHQDHNSKIQSKNVGREIWQEEEYGKAYLARVNSGIESTGSWNS